MACSCNPDGKLFTEDHRILVTGANSGIGQGIALQCNALGATVIASGRNLERLQDAKKQAAYPDLFQVEARDLLLGMEDLPEWVQALRRKYGTLGGFVHSAGLGLTAPLRMYDLDAAMEQFAIHFHAPMLIAKGFADRRNNIGHGAAMLFLGSSSALVPVKAKVVYAAAKSALLSAVRSLSKELGPQGIRVNAIAPALVETPMANNLKELMGEDVFAAELEGYPLGLGTPQDIAAMACFLLSRQSRWVTGQTILMDGGRY